MDQLGGHDVFVALSVHVVLLLGLVLLLLNTAPEDCLLIQALGGLDLTAFGVRLYKRLG
jgi:hypothetical protein